MNLRIKNIDLVADWIEILKAELTLAGYAIKNQSSEEIALFYFHFLKKRIPSTPRKILKSQFFICPPENLPGLTLLEYNITKGNDLSPYQSKQLKSIEKHDKMLYDWGIQHLHLGIKMGNEALRERTSNLLYTIFDNSMAYFIGIYTHSDFESLSLLEIIQQNWPQLIEPYRLKGPVAYESNIEVNDIGKMRKAGITTFQKISGNLYFSPGGGISMSDTSIEASRKSNKYLDFFETIECQLKENLIEFFQKKYGKIVIIKKGELHFKLTLCGDKYVVTELNNNFQFQLNGISHPK